VKRPNNRPEKKLVEKEVNFHLGQVVELEGLHGVVAHLDPANDAITIKLLAKTEAVKESRIVTPKGRPA
jgi:hypothetical protein